MKKRWLPKLLAHLLSAALVMQILPVSAFAQTATEPDGYSLQAGDPSSTYGYFYREFKWNVRQSSSDSYAISFDYMYPSSETMDGYAVFSPHNFTDGYPADAPTAAGDVYPAFIQRDDQVYAKTASAEYLVIDSLSADSWYNFTVCYSGSKVSLYLDGSLVLINDAASFDRGTAVPLRTLGFFGDITNDNHHDGYAFFDNIKLSVNGERISSDAANNNLSAFDFNSGDYTDLHYAVSRYITNPLSVSNDSDALASQPCHYSEPGISYADPELESLSVTAKDGVVPNVGVKTAVDDLFDIAATMSDGRNAVVPAGRLTVTPEDSDTVSVTAENGKTYLLFHSEEAVTMSFAFNLYGMEQTVNDVDVTACVNDLTSIEVKALTDSVYVGDQIVLKVSGIFSSGDTQDVTAEAVVTSVDTSLGDISSANGLTLLNTLAAGTVQVEASLGSLTASTQVPISAIDVAKGESTYYTPEKVATARQNITQYAWAEEEKDAAAEKADTLLDNFTLDELWSMIPSQNIPRSYGVNQLDGCLACEDEITTYGNYSYIFSTTDVDWKIECPSCHIQFPTNDFKSYYEGGLNEYGEFDPDLAKRHNDTLIAAGGTGNLVNNVKDQITANPALANSVTAKQINDPDWGVDDGMGYNYDPDDTTAYGKPYTFVAYYAHWALWYNGGMIKTAIKDLSDAYLYTGEQKYADAAIVMLDPIADLYPDMHVSQFPHSSVSGSQQYGFLPSDGWHFYPGRGKVVGSIWENELIKSVLYAYDAVFPGITTMGSEAKALLNEKYHSSNKSNPDRIKVNFEDGVLRQVFTAFKEGDLQGNPGMQQSSLALAAVIIDHYPETQEWLNFDFKTGDADWEDNVKTGGNIMEILVDDVDHDGQGNESAPGYNALWVSNWLEVAKALDGYVLPDGVSLDDGVDSDLFQNARFQKMFKAMYHLLLTNNYTANIGDTGQTGKATRAVINLDELILGYDKYGDDELAQAIYLVNGDSSKGITLDVFSENPNAVSDDIQDVLDEKGELDLGSEDQTGFGLAVLRDGETSSTYNFLNMAVSDKSDGLVINRDYPPVAQIEPDVSQGVGQSIAFDFTYSGDTSQQYQFYMEIHVVSSIWATYSVELNGHPLGKIDFADGTSGTTILKLADTYLNPGTNTVKFTNTQAGPSGSLKMGVRTMYFLEQGAVLPSNTAIANTTQRALWMYYGGPGSHAHADPLNLGYIAYDLDLMPDLGYPDTTNDSLTFFTKTTKSHNTVIVNGQPVDAAGTPTHFDDTGDVKLMSIRDNGVSGIYSAANGLYERTAALIKVDDEDSYIVDLFHLNGGSYYDYSFHTGESETANTVYTGLTLAPVSGEEASLKNFRKDTDGTSGAFSIDWNLLDTYNRYGNGIGAQTDVHLKITMLGDYDEVTVADGIPPQNVDSNPDKLEYLYVRSNDSNTTYASVIEPYQGESNITSIEEVPVTENGIAADGNAVKAIKVTLSSGRVDYVVNALDTAKTYRVANLFDFKGFYGVYTLLNGSLAHTYINDGTTIGNTDALNKATGTVTDHTATLSAENYIDIQTDQNIDAEELTGRYIYIENDGETNAVYKILDATPQGSSLRLNIGDTSVVRGWKNILDFGEGYEFDFDLGAAFTIPLSDF